MSVFTKVSHEALTTFLQQYPLGALIGFQGIGEGVENTNYFVDTEDGRFVLTLFERLDYDDLPFFLGLMAHCADRGVPCPRPLQGHDGHVLRELCGKPAALVQRLRGSSALTPNVAQCHSAGQSLAQLHAAAHSFSIKAVNTRGREWRADTAAQVRPHLDDGGIALLDAALAADSAVGWERLPCGVIHADLFRDNVLFSGEEVSGIIDFYYACNDALIFDLAVMVNDWCFEQDGRLNRARYQALTEAYCALREPTSGERAAWGAVLCAGALRFWLSRLFDWYFPRDGDLVHVKEPSPYERILRYHVDHHALSL
ncbi:homoserine kinase [Algiphilus sp.]|uniref:homoserine kinase n=1 Tax=Algiphilus sp. TaxID=1872431 RepID=UPI002A6401AE|nr:homoserine kinase [Pseudomonadota bacterium]